MATPGLAPPSLPSLDNTYGAAFIGLLGATALYGITCLQTYLYYQHYPDDRAPLKAFVAWLWVMDTFHIILISRAMYHYLITNFANPLVLGVTTWEINIHVVVNCFVAWMVQLFFAMRVYRLSKGNPIPTGVIILLASVQLGFGTAMTIKGFSLKIFSRLTTVEWIVGTSLSSTLACDLLITACLCWLLNQSRTGFKRTDSLINSLMMYALSTGLVTSVFAILNLVTFLAMPTNLVNFGINFVLGKLYANSLLATLNGRDSTRSNWHRKDTALQLSDLPTASGSTRVSSSIGQGEKGNAIAIYMNHTSEVTDDDASSKNHGRLSMQAPSYTTRFGPRMSSDHAV